MWKQTRTILDPRAPDGIRFVAPLMIRGRNAAGEVVSAAEDFDEEQWLIDNPGASLIGPYSYTDDPGVGPKPAPELEPLATTSE